MRKLLPLLAAVVLLTSACRLETNVTIDVNEDGSGSFTTELGLDEEMQGVLESFGGGEDLLSGLDLGGATPTETRVEGAMTYYSASQEFTDVAELESLLNDNQDQVAFDEFTLEVTEDGASFIAKTGPLSGQGELDPASLPFDPATLTEDIFSANIYVKLPGTVTTHNADEETSDGRLRWAISLTDPLDMEAETTFGGSGIPWVPIGIAAVVVLGIGGFLMTRRKEDAATVALRATEAPPAPMDFSTTVDTGLPPDIDLPPELPPQQD